MGTPVRVKADCHMFGNDGGPVSTYAGMVGEATNKKPIPGWEVVVCFDEGDVSFNWDELDVLPEVKEEKIETGLIIDNFDCVDTKVED